MPKATCACGVEGSFLASSRRADCSGDRSSTAYYDSIGVSQTTDGDTEEEEDGGYGSHSIPTQPRLELAEDRQRTWPVASNHSQEARDYRQAISDVCDELKAFLLEKNRSYGNSAFEPINIFSGLDAVDGIHLRIDDKLKRIKNGRGYPGDNDVKDLTGYLILLLALEHVNA